MLQSARSSRTPGWSGGLSRRPCFETTSTRHRTSWRSVHFTLPYRALSSLLVLEGGGGGRSWSWHPRYLKDGPLWVQLGLLVKPELKDNKSCHWDNKMLAVRLSELLFIKVLIAVRRLQLNYSNRKRWSKEHSIFIILLLITSTLLLTVGITLHGQMCVY